MAGPIRIAILANGSQARGEIRKTEGTLAGFGKKALKYGAVAGAAALVGIGKSAVQLEAQFSKTMNILQATSGASAREMDGLRKLAIKMGADTVFSAGDASQAMLELARGGIKPAQIAAGALQGTLTLAAAGELEMGEAANIAVKSMGQFNLAGKDMGAIAAALAGAANASSASVRDLSQALAQGGLAANSVGFSIQETTGILAAFSNAGLEGSDAGTSLKTMLDRLQPATTKAEAAMRGLGIITDAGRNKFLKANGEFQSAARIAEVLQQGTEKLNSSERKRLITMAFGSDAQRAATVLAKEGAEGLKPLIKQTSDQEAAQKQANAAMKGTAGVMERLSGAWETARLQLGLKLAPAVEKVGTALADNLEPAMEAAIRGGERIADAVAPAFRELGEALGDLGGDGKTARLVFDGFVGALKVASSAVTGVLKVWNALPDGLKSLAIQAGIAALVLPKLAAGFAGVQARATAASLSMVTFGQRLAQNRAAMTYQATALGKAREAMHGFGGMARNVAGVGGMLALAKGATESNKATGALLTTLGGAATGFAIAGPIGALIGGATSGLLGVFNTVPKVNAVIGGIPAANRPAAVSYQELKGTLDETTAAFTRATRAAVLQKLEREGLISQANTLGISTRDMIGATLGLEGPIKRVDKATGNTTDSLKALTGSKLQGWIYKNNTALEQMQRETREANEATSSWKQQLKGVPRDIITKLRQQGFETSMQQLKRLEQQGKITAREKRLILRVLGDKVAGQKLKGVDKSLKGLPKDSPLRILLTGTDKVNKDAKGVQRNLEDVKNTKGDPTRWKNDVKQGVAQGKQTATRGAADVARGLRDGTARANANLGPFQSSLRGGISSARGTASSGGHGIGSALGAGVSSGIGSWIGNVVSQARSMVAQAVAAARAQAQVRSPSRVMIRLGGHLAEGVSVGLARNTKRVGKNARKFIKKVLAGIREELKTQREAILEYRTGIVDAAKSFGSVTNLNSAFNSQAMAQQMRARLEQVRTYNQTLTRLISMGLDRTLVDQLAQAGVEGGLAFAQAIERGGLSSVAEFNDLQRQMNTAAATLGNTTAASKYGTTNNVTIQVKVGPTSDKAAVGREVAKALDAYYSQGGRVARR